VFIIGIPSAVGQVLHKFSRHVHVSILVPIFCLTAFLSLEISFFRFFLSVFIIKCPKTVLLPILVSAGVIHFSIFKIIDRFSLQFSIYGKFLAFLFLLRLVPIFGFLDRLGGSSRLGRIFSLLIAGIKGNRLRISHA